MKEKHAGPTRLRSLAAPAVAVMNRLTYPRKFAVVSLLFALPLGVVLLFLITEMNNRIEFARKEIQGDQYFRPLQKLFGHVLESRILARDHVGGKDTARPGLVRKQAEIDEDIKTLNRVDRQLGEILKTTSKHDALVENWRFLREKIFHLEGSDTEDLHTQLLAEIDSLREFVGDTSNLVLDPDLDSYYLMDATLLKLPRSQELLAQASMFGIEGVAVDRTSSPKKRAEISRIATLLRDNRNKTQQAFNAAFRNNPAANLRLSLKQLLQEHLGTTDALLNAIDAQTPALSLGEYDRLIEQCLNTNFSLWDQSVIDLDRLLQARIDLVARREQMILISSFSIIALVIYLLVAFYFGVMTP